MPTATTKHEFMHERWGFDSNPLPANTINTRVDDINESVFPDEFRAVRDRLVADAVVNKRPLGFLWSVPPTPGGDDTGLGKTGTMRRVAWTMNQDWAENLIPASIRARRGDEVNAVALYTSFDRNRVTSVNAALFDAVVYAAKPDPRTGVSLYERLHQRVLDRHQLNPQDPELTAKVRVILAAARSRIAAGRPALRADVLEALAAGGEAAAAHRDDGVDVPTLADTLEGVSDVARMRNGLDYFEAFFTLAHAAGVPHVFVFVDQLEDLANNTVARQKRAREVERIRDVAAENPMFAGFLHLVFTMHARAQHAVEGFWREARLPRFDRAPITDAYVVTLEGVRTDEQVAELLRTYFRPARADRPEDIAPFDASALTVLRQARDGRVGPILDLAYQAFERAAAHNVETIDAGFLRALVDGAEIPSADTLPRRAAAGRDARLIDDVLG